MASHRKVEWVDYGWSIKTGQHLEVEHLISGRDVHEQAPEIRDLLRRVGDETFGGLGRPVPYGTFASRYGVNCNEEFVADTMRRFQGGSQFWVIRLGNRGLAGFVEAAPLQDGDTDRPPSVHIARIAVESGDAGRTSVIGSQQRLGYGSALVHAALQHGDFEYGVPVVASTLEAGEDRIEAGRLVAGTNDFFRNMGLKRTGSIEPSVFPNGVELDMCSYETPAGAHIDTVVNKLVENNWILARGLLQRA